MNKPLKIAFFGTPEFSVKILEIMRKNEFSPGLIITSSDKPIGRKMKLTPSPVKKWAGKHNILVAHDYEPLKSLKPDLCIVASFGKIIPVNILEIPERGFLNIHPSLLPEFRGPSPIQSAILENKKETGVTIMLMNEKMDEGPILAAEKIKIPEKINAGELEENLADLGGKLLVETIPEWMSGKIKPQEQDHSKATYTKKITKNDGLVNLNDPPETIAKKIRAFNPWPGVFAFINGRRIIITQVEINNNTLKIKHIKPEGKKEMELKNFLKGNPDKNIEKYL